MRPEDIKNLEERAKEVRLAFIATEVDLGLTMMEVARMHARFADHDNCRHALTKALASLQRAETILASFGNGLSDPQAHVIAERVERLRSAIREVKT